MYYYTANLSPSVIIRDAIIVKWAVMQQTKRVTFTHTSPDLFFCLFLKSSFQLITGITRSVIVAHCRSLQIIVDHCRSLQIIVGHCRPLQVIPCFSNYDSIFRTIEARVSETVKKISKITYTESRFSLLTSAKVHCLNKHSYTFQHNGFITMCNLQKRLIRAAF